MTKNVTKLAQGSNLGALTLLPLKEILSQQNSIFKTVGSVDQRIHANALQCALHAMEHGDVMPADRLVKGLGGKNSEKAIAAAIAEGRAHATDQKMTGVYVPGLVMWFQMFTPITWNGDAKPGLLKAGMKLYDRLIDRNAGKAWNIEEASAKPWFTLKEVRRDMERAPLTLEAIKGLVVGFTKRIEKSIEEGTFEGDPGAAYDYVKTLTRVALPAQRDDKVIHPTNPKVKGAIVPVAKGEAVEAPQTGNVIAA